MKRNLYLSFLVLLLLGGFQSVRAQTFTVTQDMVFNPATTSNCFYEVFNSQQSSWTGANITVNMSHDIFGNQTSPTYYNTVNNSGWRYIYFDIYKVGSTSDIYETTITKYSRILQGGVSSGSSSITYNLNTLDLINANLSSGDKKVRVRFKMQLSNLSLPVNGEVKINGALQCSKSPLDGSSLSCNIGWIDCFTYLSCGELNVTSSAELVPVWDKWGNFLGHQPRYTYIASIPGGSGNYTYSWSGPGYPSSSTGNTFVFNYNATNPAVYLTVTDNVTGCTYTYWSGKKTGAEGELSQELSIVTGPNPASAGEKITVNFNLPTADDYQLAIFDLSGKKIAEAPSQDDSFAGEHSIELTPVLSPGIYLVRLNTSNHGSKTSKLVVQ